MPNVHVKLTVAGHEIEGAVAVPEGQVPVRAVLPVLRQLTDTIVALAERGEAEAGRKVSCRAGCGACCRQMVPLAPAEALALAQLVAAMPAQPRRKVLQRFAAGHAKLKKARVLAPLRRRHALPADALQALDAAYFAAHVACPFLQEESCSIHPERPLACREYLVTSPAAHCAHPTADRVAQVPIPAKLSQALTAVSGNTRQANPWVPLILALEYVRHRKEKLAGHAPEIVAHVLRRL